jgi:hypothetical protein
MGSTSAELIPQRRSRRNSHGGAGACARVCRVDGPFIGSDAVAAGLITVHELRNPRFQQVYRDVYVEDRRKLDLRARSEAAHLLVPPDGALGGYSAAELLGAECSPPNAAAELIAPRGDVRKRRGLKVRQDALSEE